MKIISVSIVCILLFGCIDNHNKNQAIDISIEKEIKERIVKIKTIAKQNDTVFVDPDEVDKKIGDLILISKDIENLKACANLSNQYFIELSRRFGLNIDDFQKINTGMHVDDIASTLKQNEMIFLNHILLKTGVEAVPMHTAR
jgi:hypothetical protein